jgi:hypothetical protein
MSRPKRKLDDHWVLWDDKTNTITIKPRKKGASATGWFGLGNAKIQINTANPPKKIVKKITGETSGSGFLPTQPFGLRRWFCAPEGVDIVSLELEGFNGWKATINYAEASGGDVKEVQDVKIVQNGYGIKRFGPWQRYEW